MIMECTDCEHCASFQDGYRVYCLHPDLPADQVCDFYPVGERDAEDCSGFEEGYPHDFWGMKEIEAYEKYCEEKYGDITYEGIREWCELQIKERGI